MYRVEYYNDEEYLDSEELYKITENRISALSRHLQTYLNNKKATIRAICSDFENTPNKNVISGIHKWEEELTSRIWEYINYLKKNVKKDDILKREFLSLAEKAKSSPGSHETELFKNFLRNKIRLWQILHILSGLEIHVRPQLLKLVLKLLIRLYHEEGELNEVNPEFFKQIKLNYELLVREYEHLCISKDKDQRTLKTKRMVVREW